LENWRPRNSDEWLRTFCFLTTNANELVNDIHGRMPVIIPPLTRQYQSDPRDLLGPTRQTC
jgi:putative SOS response-associated peptidase YedK